MSTSLQNVLALVARLLLVALFLPAGLSKITGFSGTVDYIASAGVPLAALAAVVAIVVEVAGALALLTGVGTRFAAAVLAFFTLSASVLFHDFWAVPQEQVMVQQLLFFKNIAVVGGLLMLVAYGGGHIRVPSRSGAIARPAAGQA